MNDTAKMLLQVTDEGEVTWDQFLKEYAVKQLSLRAMVVKEAEANGMGADEHTQEELAATMEELNAAAKQNGYSTKTYLMLIYGKNMTVDTFKEMVQLVDVATHYQRHYAEELTYTVSDLETYYQGNKSSFDVASYESLYYKGTADSTKDDDGNTVEPTDEETAAAKAKAESDAAAVLARVQGGEALEEKVKDFESASYTSTDAGSNTNGGLYTKIYKNQMVTEFNDWCFDESRQPGDTGIVETSYGVHVMYFDGFGNSYRDTLVENALRTADYNAWHDGVVGDNAYTTVPFGMKFTTK